MQTELQREESEKAYKRSSAPNQVGLMTAAGMSRAGAINALNGGGSYTPAPISLTSPDVKGTIGELPRLLVDALSSFSANTAQMAQLQEQKRQFNLTNKLEQDKLEFEKKKWQDEKPTRDESLKNLIDAGEKLRAEAKKIGFETNILETNKEILDLTKQDKVDAENAESLARKVRAENQKYIEDVRAKGLNNIDETTFKQLIASITEREAVATTLEMFGLYLREKGSSAAGALLKEFATQSSMLGSPLTSINP